MPKTLVMPSRVEITSGYRGHSASRLERVAREILWVRRKRSAANAQACDAECTVLLGSGVLQGDSNAPDEFLDAFRGHITQWSYGDEAATQWHFTRCEIAGGLHDCSLYKFVDDVLQFLILKEGANEMTRQDIRKQTETEWT